MNHSTSTGIPGFTRPAKASPENSSSIQESPTASRIPRSCVDPSVAHLSPTRVRPRRMNRNARVTMKEGSPVLRTMCAFSQPSEIAKAKVSRIATHSGAFQTASVAPKTSPAKATIDPIERSNSPATIRSAAPTARIPSCAAGLRKFITPAEVNIAGSAVVTKNRATTIRPPRRDNALLRPDAMPV